MAQTTEFTVTPGPYHVEQTDSYYGFIWVKDERDEVIALCSAPGRNKGQNEVDAQALSASCQGPRQGGAP